MNAWILAGGRSRRFGSDKALHPVDGRPLVLVLADRLAAAGLRPGVVGKSPRGLPLPERLEPEPGHHPLYGVAAALVDGPALVCPVDLIDLDVARVRRLLDAWDAHPGGVYAAGQPLLGVFPAHLAAPARAAADAGASVRSFVASLVPVDLGPLVNLNRPGGSGSEAGGAP